MPQFIATCATGLEYLLVDELIHLGAENVKEGLSLVNFEVEWKGAYQILMWSRLASRVYYPIASFEAEDDETLYNHCAIIDWSQHLNSQASFLVNSQTFRSKLSHTKFISQRIKDAVVDFYEDQGEKRPDVEFDQPEVVIHCRIKRNKVTLSIDLAGVGLHRRGYRQSGGAAPIKENLASALLIRAGWPNVSQALLDPMCGSGTFLIEAAMSALDIAPGLNRDYLGLLGWRQFNPELWQEVKAEAELRKQAGLKASQLSIIGSDINPKSVRNAQMNVAMAGLEDFIKVHIAGIDQLAQMDFPEKGLVIVNPPYSERLGERDEVTLLYQALGQVLKNQFGGWQASVLSPDKAFGHALGIRAKKIYKFNNGSIPCELLNFDISEKHFTKSIQENDIDEDFREKLSEQGLQLANRLDKNKVKLKKYLKKEMIECYRVYDADLPEYNVAIDIYKDCIHIQEYKAPKTVDMKLAARRLKEIERIASGVFQVLKKNIYIKQRQQQKGDWQYSRSSKSDHSNRGHLNRDKPSENFFTVNEGGRRFLVNLIDYLDTGLFLDHRKTREKIALLTEGKRLLNLFCYTGSISVYAATAGAKSTTNVDMSRTYLDWAKRNFIENTVDLEKHQFIRADCVEWLKEASDKYDVIFLDPPTFSNSKKMTDHFDIQQDHVTLIAQCVNLLNEGGVLLFSNNFKKFQMQVETNEVILVKELTKQTVTLDFQRKPLHRIWSIEKR